MKKIIILIMMVAIILGAVSVNATVLVPNEYQVSVDFQGERDFRLILPNGYERHFYWDEGKQHSDETFTHTVYNELDEEKWCTNVDKEITQYKNITRVMTNMLDKCSDIYGMLNKSSQIAKQIDEAISDREEYERLLFICEDRRKGAENESAEYKIESESFGQDYKTCNSQLTSLRGSSQNCATCTTELKDYKSSKNNRNIWFAFGGFGAAYWIWGRKRKKKGQPSEQSESGTSSDEIAQKIGGEGPRH